LEREILEFDVQFVGAGPAGLAGAIHLANLIAKHNQAIAAGAPGEAIGETNIAVIEKRRRLALTASPVGSWIPAQCVS
jgi:electron-transferring-flavoprotein dehydrogenase